MRSEGQMYDLILSTARDDERIRAVILNGSRANPNAPRDIFQDFDILYIVTDVAAFKQDPHWIDRFGELMILQLPDDMTDPPPLDNPGYTFLMQFSDGNRIDLNLFPVDRLTELEEDSLTVVLLDKDSILSPFPPSNESGYLPKPPTAKQFFDCCNEFWWVSPYAAKGLWRGEIVYARHMADQYVREQLMKMLHWYIGVKTGFALNPGKYGKYYRRYLEPELWELLMQTYSDAAYDHTWDALETMGKLFRRIAIPVAEHFGYDYPHAEDKKVSAHLQHMRSLPRDADSIY